MSNISATVIAKALYVTLRKHNLITEEFEGLMGDAVWISKGNRAYRLKDLSDGHLDNILKKYKEKEEAVPQVIAEEYANRIDAK